MILPASIVFTFGLLVLAILTHWSTRTIGPPHRGLPLWTVVLTGATLAALINGYVTPVGAALLALLYVLGRLAVGPTSVRPFAYGGTVVLAAGLMAHQVPGFHNPLLLDAHHFSNDAAAYTQHANFDKGAAGLILLGLFSCASIGGNWRALRQTLPIAVFTCTAVIAGALLLGYARADPKLPPYAPVFLVANLFFTCVAEEALFRLLLLQRLLGYLQSRNLRHAPALALCGIALLFGLVHTGGGWGYVILATIAGIGYGYAYLRTQRVEAAILVHFTVNAVHFLGFTFPRLA